MLYLLFCVSVFVFFFKQKTAYEMRISDWSSDVCSSDLYEMLQRCVKAGVAALANPPTHGANDRELVAELASVSTGVAHVERLLDRVLFTACEIGRASCRERVCQYV